MGESYPKGNILIAPKPGGNAALPVPSPHGLQPLARGSRGAQQNEPPQPYSGKWDILISKTFASLELALFSDFISDNIFFSNVKKG